MAPSTADLVGQYLREAARIEKARREKRKYRNVEASPFWPHEAVRSTVIVLAFSAAVMYISALMPYFLEAPAKSQPPEVILPDWYLLWSYGLLKPGVANSITWAGVPIELPILGPLNAKTMGILLNMVIMLPLIAAPLISLGKARRPQEAPWTAAFGVAGIVYVFNISLFGSNNVVYTEISWWKESLAQHPWSIIPMAGGLPIAGAVPSLALSLATMLFWVLPLPLAAFLVRTRWLGESVKFAGAVAALHAFILVTIVAYGNGLDLPLMVQDPAKFLYTALKNTDLLSWATWWTTPLSFELAYWSLVGWKRHSLRKETYEHDLNLTYHKVR